jgi:cytochrome c oxidase subunit II
VIVAVFAASVLLLGSLARRGEDARLTIALTGHRWWWSVQYLQPEGGAVSTVTANEIHIPVGQRVRIELLARDVIHSLWVPRLNGKVDLVPGRTNTIWLHADRPGVYRGQCAEFCGLQHARMALYVVAHEPGEFERWLAREREPAAVPAAGSAVEAGFRVFQASCASCHTVRGTTARGVIGPDLTHVASRRSLAAGTLPNTIGHLSAWVAAPQRIKPGSGMPNPQLSAVALQQVGQYLATLR